MAQEDSQDYFGRIPVGEEDEKLLDEDVSDDEQPIFSRRRRWSSFAVASLITNAVLLGLVIYLALPLSGNPLDRAWMPLEKHEIAGDINWIWPKRTCNQSFNAT